MPATPSAESLAPILDDLGASPADFAPTAAGALPSDAASVVVPARGAAVRDALLAVGERGVVLAVFDGEPDGVRLADLREALWPELHAVAFYRARADVTLRRSHGGGSSLAACPAAAEGARTVVALRRTSHVLSPEATREKFDANAPGWDDSPSNPSWPHFRWMRRYVATFGLPARAERVLDFGCGAGWVGVEAAKRTGAALSAFDPSPEMVKRAEQNARASGVASVDARVGFGEDPPFPSSEPFDVVISAGVVSFSPDVERWTDGLTNLVAPGGTLIVADLNPRSQGMRARRRTRPLVPVRELNAQTAEAMRARIERRGFAFRARSDYQLSRPVPQLMHLNETKLGGALSHPLVWFNALGSAIDGLSGGLFNACFDSWVLRFERRQ